MRAALGAWYAAHRRRLPWREQPSLYKTVVSEFMLQQTQVETVLPYFERWLKRFPDFPTLAKARESQVLKMWEGLGYYRRARLLQALARELVKMPAPPKETAAWLKLPGVGPYTAAAITSIAFGAPAAVVDGNVVRVLARLRGEGREFADGMTAVKFFTPAADALLDAANPGDHNQAMMELGATVCTRRNPTCLICPLLTWCAAAQSGNPEALPRLAAKKTERVEIARLWIEHDGALLLHRKPAGAKRLAHLCELPEAGMLPGAKIEKMPLAVKRRTIVNHLYLESIHRATLPASIGKILPKEFLWASPAQLQRLTLSGPHRKWVAELRRDRAFRANHPDK
ncbi:MAG TPA: A/G-specific adenine glycosylase [Opitutales bacterium]|nr:A/G-specific adenine glycosylase [Opitutales bacterium]